MLRHYAFSYRAHAFPYRPSLLPLTKAQHARWICIIKPRSRYAKLRASRVGEIIHPATPELLFKILYSRSTFISPWKVTDTFSCDNAVAAPDGLVSPGGVCIRFGRRRRDPYIHFGISIPQGTKFKTFIDQFKSVDNALWMDTIEDHQESWFIHRLINYVEWNGLYALGREDDSPLQPHMWEIPKGTVVPPSLRLTSESNSRLLLGPAFPMSLECLNQNLEQFMLECDRVTPLRHWFTPEQEFCKNFPE